MEQLAENLDYQWFKDSIRVNIYLYMNDKLRNISNKKTNSKTRRTTLKFGDRKIFYKTNEHSYFHKYLQLFRIKLF